MRFLRRVSKYIIPQWHRVLVVFVAAFLVGLLFSVSFITIIPFLKVMMGEEGLHGWIDRKACDNRYGIDFYLPDRNEIINENNLLYELRIIKVEEDSLAAEAGLMLNDSIIAVGEDPNSSEAVSSYLLRDMASASGEGYIDVKVLRHSGKTVETIPVSLKKPDRFMYEEQSFFKKYGWGIKWEIIDAAQKVVSRLPRDDTKLAKQKAITFILIAMIFISIARCIAGFVQKYVGAKVVQNATAQLREELFGHAMNMPMEYFTVHGTSDATSRLMGDVGGVGKGVQILLGKSLQEPMKAMIMLSAAMFLNWKLTSIFLISIPPIALIMSFFGKKVRKYTRKGLVLGAEMLGKLNESMGALRVIKVYNQQEREGKDYKLLSRKLLRQTLRQVKANAATGPIMDIIGMLAGSAAMLLGVMMVTNQNMEPSVFFGILIMLGCTAESIRKTSDVWNSIQNSNAAIDRIDEFLDEPVEYEKPDSITVDKIRGDIIFKDIVFTYPKADKPVLKGVNLSVKAGHNIAIVGHNGSGKTTLINLLPRFFNTDSGQIFIDGIDVADMTLNSLRSHIAMVTQNVITFHDTIAANIAYGKPDISMEQIIGAAKQSYAHEFIKLMPNGYDTVIGEHGTGLSGGQLQRIVIARAILKDPEILIFDEAMSQVDADSEAKIHDAIEKLMHNRTSFVIAHRFSTIISADIIVVMDAGEIVDQGSHQYLMEKCDVYQRLYKTQLMPE